MRSLRWVKNWAIRWCGHTSWNDCAKELSGRTFALKGEWRHREQEHQVWSGWRRKQFQEDRCYKYQMKYEGWRGWQWCKGIPASMSILRNVLLGSKICRSDEKKIGLGSGRSCYNCGITSREALADPARSSEDGMMKLGWERWASMLPCWSVTKRKCPKKEQLPDYQQFSMEHPWWPFKCRSCLLGQRLLNKLLRLTDPGTSLTLPLLSPSSSLPLF